MQFKPKHTILLVINILSLIVFGTIFLARQNYEFVIYVGVIIIFLIVIAATYKKVPYTDTCLFGLTIWAILHLAGGCIYIDGTRLYRIMLFPLSDKYPVFRYDQFVHIWGFGSATIAMYCVLKPLLKEDLNRFVALSIVVAMAGLGVGAFNEILEFITAEIVAESGVGGYMNTSLDSASNLIGAIIAAFYIRFRYL